MSCPGDAASKNVAVVVCVAKAWAEILQARSTEELIETSGVGMLYQREMLQTEESCIGLRECVVFIYHDTMQFQVLEAG